MIGAYKTSASTADIAEVCKMNAKRNTIGKLVLFVLECLCLPVVYYVGCDGQLEGEEKFKPRRRSKIRELYRQLPDLQLRGLNDSTDKEGRVELYHDGQWGTVCDDYWDDLDATVVCRQLNLGKFGLAIQKVKFGKGSGKIWLDDVDCTGQEEFLVNCSSRPIGEHDCRHSEDAGVRCRDILHCKSEPCLNGGTCVERANSYTCSCPENFGGYICQYERPSEPHLNTTTGSLDGSQTMESKTESRNGSQTMETETLTDKQGYVTTEVFLATTRNLLYSLVSPYIIDIVLSIAWLCTMVSLLCMICWIKRKLNTTGNWERRDSFVSDDAIALTSEGHQLEHNLNDYNVQRQHNGKDDGDEEAWDYEMPKSGQQTPNENMHKLYENITRH